MNNSFENFLKILELICFQPILIISYEIGSAVLNNILLRSTEDLWF